MDDSASAPPGAGSSVWPVLHYDDTRAAVRFLVGVLGFHEVLAAADEQGDLVHVELSRSGGGLVLGSTKHTDSVHGAMRPGTSAVYLVEQDVDAVHARVVEHGGEVVEAPHDARFGSGAVSRTLTVRDPEGNLWTFGTYRGAGA